MACIFCRGIVSNNRIEHILPESLGGKNWACLPSGLVCDSCNQYFGSKVEREALQSFPFLPFRLLLGIPTKKSRLPEMNSTIGRLKSGGLPGLIGLDPTSSELEARIVSGKVSRFTILAEVTEPLAVCRFLLKMGLEVVAADSADDARISKFDNARKFARSPSKGKKWWFLLHTDHEALFSNFRKGITVREWIEGVKLEVVEVQGAEIFHLQLLNMNLITPLDDRVLPPSMESLPEPDYRLVFGECI
jgi:hypothetical protein